MNFFDCLHNRIEDLRGRLAEKNLDALVLIDDENAGWENLYYYSGFRGSSGIAVITHRQAILVTDSRYLTQASQQSCMEVRPTVTREKHTATFKRLMDELKLRRCGYDGGMLSAANYLALASLPVEWVDFTSEMSRQRRRKDEYEVSLITQAAEIASAAYLETLPEVKAGMTELEFSKILELNIARRGGEGVWHKSKMIVASGVRSAMPHGVAGTKAMARGDQVTVDYGAIYGGYMSDLTRNFSLGPVRDPEFNDIHGVLLKAHRDSAACLRPGAKGRDVHAVAQKIIADAGYGDYFGHGLGHSFGLEIHEMPRLSPASEDILQPGDVVTVEPGIYIPGRGGLRIEDDYLITADGARRISKNLPQEFLCLNI